MAKDDQQEAFERALTSTLTRVIDLLKFAEAKNAALLTLSSAWILGAVNLLTGSNALLSTWRTALTIALPLFAVAALVAITSFLPRTVLARFHKDPDQARSLLYFGDAAQFAPAAYRDRIRERYYPPDGETANRNYLDDLSIQIAVTSQITKRKMTLFNAGAGVLLLSLVVLAVPSALVLWRLTGLGGQ